MVGIKTKAVDAEAGSALSTEPFEIQHKAAANRLSLCALSLVAGVAFGGLLLFAAIPRPGESYVLVVFTPGTSQSHMVEVVTRAGARLVAFSRLSFAVEVHVETMRTIDRLRAGSLLLTTLRGVAGCMRPSPSRVAGFAA